MKKTFYKKGSGGSYVKVSFNSDRAEQLHSTLLAGFVTRVGILGNKTTRMATVSGKRVYGWGESRTVVAAHKKSKDKKALMTNAEIGLLHEKGSLTRRIERRSFLEMPLVTKSEGLAAGMHKIWHEFLNAEMSKANLRSAYVKLGMLAERIIAAAFETEGFGRWKKDSPATIAAKGSSMALIDTSQLRRSITSDVVAR